MIFKVSFSPEHLWKCNAKLPGLEKYPKQTLTQAVIVLIRFPIILEHMQYKILQNFSLIK